MNKQNYNHYTCLLQKKQGEWRETSPRVTSKTAGRESIPALGKAEETEATTETCASGQRPTLCFRVAAQTNPQLRQRGPHRHEETEAQRKGYLRTDSRHSTF